ncbi:hypothetical protein [Aeromonas simiae]|uniref:hypothetical protein n=1 Tax=Aeromonas simiae TaxID=218936 RepID=UPI0005AA525D|nr:hypothetical protein [Aeromonas simiae]
MLTGAILLLSFCLNVYALLQLRKAGRALKESNAALLAFTRHLQSESDRKVVIQQITGDAIPWSPKRNTH